MVSKARITFLGTSGAIPTAERNHTAILLTYQGENILVDCGEGTQRQFRKAKLNPCKLTKILITHWHGDHVLGLPGLLQTLALSEYNKELTIYGPKGTKKFLENMFKIFLFRQKFPLKIIEVEKDGVFFENEEFYLESKRVIHNAPCNSYCFVKKDERRIDKVKLKKSGLPFGPLLQKLKQGKDISYKSKKFRFKNLTFEKKGFKICFILDTKYHKGLINFAKDSTALVCESTFEPGREDLANKHFHLSANQSAEIAKKAKVKKLFLTHISQRQGKRTEKTLKEVSKIFKRVALVDDLFVAEI